MRFGQSLEVKYSSVHGFHRFHSPRSDLEHARNSVSMCGLAMESLKSLDIVCLKGGLINNEESKQTGRKLRPDSRPDRDRNANVSRSGGGESVICSNCGAEKASAGIMCPECFYWDSEDSSNIRPKTAEPQDLERIADEGFHKVERELRRIGDGIWAIVALLLLGLFITIALIAFWPIA